jgi:hypothetical protein
MIFLSNNTLMKSDLQFEDIKPRLLGQFPPRRSSCFNADPFGRPLGNVPRIILNLQSLELLDSPA